jgi:hypothetical protein
VEPALRSVITLIGYLCPAVLVIGAMLLVVVWASRQSRRSFDRFAEQLALQRDMKRLLEESVALQKETNRLLELQAKAEAKGLVTR